ncbi:hypothetical protein [Bosea sp. TND4EK4]|uniref:hypothetical protein n=1 Tax=Bosea sp. TND4EK4 TaxID=1907408 RepID=UPI000956647F|nr:hypothetical protein [Bosea sp. TND4EK4]SIQ02205.1 hypothetical protein SAMN05880592_101591 [Bosea sp. TND4EK4]
MLASHLRIGLAVLALAGAASLAAGPAAYAQASGSRPEAGRERPPHGYDWRPAPPAVHGFWGQRRWQRYSDNFGVRGLPTSSYGDARR